METTDEFRWVNDYLAPMERLDRQQIDSIMCFALIWNLFEGNVCKQHASIDKFQGIVDRLDSGGFQTLKDLEEPLRYFSTRYITNGTTSNLFDTLRFRPSDKRELVEDVLLGRKNSPKDILLALLIIVYRLRNNLFHGIKSLHTLGGQVDNFKHANRILRQIIASYPF